MGKQIKGFFFESVPTGESLIRQLEQLFPYAAVCLTDGYRYARELGLTDEPPPEERLLIAVLLQARKDLVSPSPSTREDARVWVLQSNRTDHYGFVPLCRYLRLDPARVRAQFFADARKDNPGGNIHLHSSLRYEARGHGTHRTFL